MVSTWEAYRKNNEYYVGLENIAFSPNAMRLFFDVAKMPLLYPYSSPGVTKYCGMSFYIAFPLLSLTYLRLSTVVLMRF